MHYYAFFKVAKLFAKSLSRLASMDLDTAIMEAKKAIHCFFNNDFDEAKKIMEPWADSSMYHSLGTSVFAFLEAILTFEQVFRYLTFFLSSIFLFIRTRAVRNLSSLTIVLCVIFRNISWRHQKSWNSVWVCVPNTKSIPVLRRTLGK